MRSEWVHFVMGATGQSFPSPLNFYPLPFFFVLMNNRIESNLSTLAGLDALKLEAKGN